MSLYEIYPNYIVSEDSISSVNTETRSMDPADQTQKKKREKENIVLLDTSNIPVNSLRMLGMTVSKNVKHSANGTWSNWVDYIKRHDPNLCLKEAALVYARSGNVIAASKGISICTEEAISILQLFEHNRLKQESFRCSDRTYVIKSTIDGAVVGFYGGTYCIIGQSQKLLVIGLCTSRTRSHDAVNFIVKVAQKLSRTNH